MSMTTPTTASAWVIDAARSRVDFVVRHLTETTVAGQFKKFDVDLLLDDRHPERSSLTARIDAASVDTGEPQRDALLRSPLFFDAKRFPFMTFTSRRIDVGGDGHVRVHGDLTIRDVTRPVTLVVTPSWKMRDPWGKVRAAFRAQVTIDRKDFGLTWNAAYEVGWIPIGDDIAIAVDAEVVKDR